MTESQLIIEIAFLKAKLQQLEEKKLQQEKDKDKYNQNEHLLTILKVHQSRKRKEETKYYGKTVAEKWNLNSLPKDDMVEPLWAIYNLLNDISERLTKVENNCNLNNEKESMIDIDIDI